MNDTTARKRPDFIAHAVGPEPAKPDPIHPHRGGLRSRTAASASSPMASHFPANSSWWGSTPSCPHSTASSTARRCTPRTSWPAWYAIPPTARATGTTSERVSAGRPHQRPSRGMAHRRQDHPHPPRNGNSSTGAAGNCRPNRKESRHEDTLQHRWKTTLEQLRLLPPILGRGRSMPRRRSTISCGRQAREESPKMTRCNREKGMRI